MGSSKNLDDTANTFLRLGGISLILAVLSATRMGLELYLTRALGGSPQYTACTTYDFLQALAAGISGVAMLRRLRWAMPVTLITGTAIFLSAVIALVVYGAGAVRMFVELRFSQNLELWAGFGSRWFITAIHAVYWPIVLGHLYIDLQCRPPEEADATRELKRSFWICILPTLAVCGAVEVLLWKLGQPT